MTFTVSVAAATANSSVAGPVSVVLAGCSNSKSIVGGFCWDVAGTTPIGVSITGESNGILIGSPAAITGGLNGAYNAQLFYLANETGGSGSKTAQVTWTGTAPDCTIWAMEVAGGNLSALPDTNASWHQEVSFTGSSSTASASVTTDTADCLIISMVVGGQLADPTTPAGYTGLTLTPLGERAKAAYKLDSGTAGANNFSYTLGAADKYALVTAAFRIATGVASPGPLPRQIYRMG